MGRGRAGSALRSQHQNPHRQPSSPDPCDATSSRANPGPDLRRGMLPVPTRGGITDSVPKASISHVACDHRGPRQAFSPEEGVIRIKRCRRICDSREASSRYSFRPLPRRPRWISFRSGAALLVGFALISCDSVTTTPDPVAVPSSIIGYKLIQTIGGVQLIQSGQGTSTLGPGQNLTYQFVDQQTILGAGLTTLPTRSWSYSRIGSNGAVVTLDYGVGGSVDTLTFNTETTGEFVGHHRIHQTGSHVRYAGTFRIDDVDPEALMEPCARNGTGSVTFWLSNSQAVSRVDLTVQGLGSRSTTSWFQSAPTCGASQSGTMEFLEVPAGTYTFTAKDQHNLTWGPAEVTVPVCQCVLFGLH